MPQIGFFTGLYIVLTSSRDESFSDGWRRMQHIRNGHNFANSTRIDKLRSEKHPHSDAEYVYTVNLMRCNDCGLNYHDAGLEFRARGKAS